LLCLCVNAKQFFSFYNIKILQCQNREIKKKKKKKKKRTNHEMKEIHNSSQNGKFQNKRRYRYYDADEDCVQNDE